MSPSITLKGSLKFSFKKIIASGDMSKSIYTGPGELLLAPPSIGGLINLRGQVITALDLRRRLGMADRPEGARPMNVVVRTEEGVVSLLVDQIGEVIETDAAHFEQPPDTVAPQARDLIRGAYKLDGQLLLALDVQKAVFA